MFNNPDLVMKKALTADFFFANGYDAHKKLSKRVVGYAGESWAVKYPASDNDHVGPGDIDHINIGLCKIRADNRIGAVKHTVDITDPGIDFAPQLGFALLEQHLVYVTRKPMVQYGYGVSPNDCHCHVVGFDSDKAAVPVPWHTLISALDQKDTAKSFRAAAELTKAGQATPFRRHMAVWAHSKGANLNYVMVGLNCAGVYNHKTDQFKANRSFKRLRGVVRCLLMEGVKVDVRET